MINIIERFLTIQGEGFNVGLPSYLIRISGCLMNCEFCDSKFALNVKFNEGEHLYNEKDIKDFVQLIKRRTGSAKNIILTGGEPLLERNLDLLKILIRELNLEGFSIIIETTMIPDLSDLIKKSVVYNASYIHEKLENRLSKISYSISPKILRSCYPMTIEFDNICNYYDVSKYNYKIQDQFFNLCSYKIVYNYEYENIVKEFIEKCIPTNYRNKSYLMPLTKIPEDVIFDKENKKHCVDFCEKYNLRYSPRLHIEIFGLDVQK